MEVTILDGDGNRHDPDIVEIKEEDDRVILITRHPESVSFSRGDRVEIILASDTYGEDDPSEFVKEREEMSAVASRCVVELSGTTYCWEIRQVSAVNDVLDADPDSRLSITDFN